MQATTQNQAPSWIHAANLVSARLSCMIFTMIRDSHGLSSPKTKRTMTFTTYPISTYLLSRWSSTAETWWTDSWQDSSQMKWITPLTCSGWSICLSQRTWSTIKWAKDWSLLPRCRSTSRSSSRSSLGSPERRDAACTGRREKAHQNQARRERRAMDSKWSSGIVIIWTWSRWWSRGSWPMRRRWGFSVCLHPSQSRVSLSRRGKISLKDWHGSTRFICRGTERSCNSYASIWNSPMNTTTTKDRSHKLTKSS